jgi:3-(3-hydroxy-phenyl)propionate hydroxylase
MMPNEHRLWLKIVLSSSAYVPLRSSWIEQWPKINLLHPWAVIAVEWLGMVDNSPVIVVGMGPVGTVLAVALAQQGIPIVLLEKSNSPELDQRSATIHPPTLEMLDELGITERIMPLGLRSSVVRHWDRVTGEKIADFDMSVLAPDTRYPFVLQYEHYKLVRLLLEDLKSMPGVEMHFGVEVVEVDGGETPVVTARDAEGKEMHFVGSFVVGADGGRSAVRKSAGIAFDGFTYEERFLKVMTPFDFAAGNSAYALRNFFSDPDEWCNLFKVIGEGPPGLWRVVFPAKIAETNEEALDPANIQRRLKRFLPSDHDYEIASSAIYSVHQRVAETFLRGHIILVGDAAHLNNPIGGMGMNGGIHDAINLSEKLARVWRGDEGEELLGLYDRQRRGVAIDFVQAQTIRNKKQLEERDPEVRRRNLAALRETAQDPVRCRAHLRAASLIDSVEASYNIS